MMAELTYFLPISRGLNKLRSAAIFCFIFLCLFTYSNMARSQEQPAAAKRPNIILLVADDWGFSDVGAYGAEIATPHLDQLAYQGVRFSNFHVAGSCAPTRAMLHTGVMNHRNGLGNMAETIPDEHVGKPGYDSMLNFRVVTMAEILKSAGYRTYLTGKWHLGDDARRLPHARGFDRAFSLEAAGADNFEQKPITGLARTAAWSENSKPVILPKNYYSSRFVVDQMIQYIEAERSSGRPFFASINFLANHIPIQAPDADLEAYRGYYEKGWHATRKARAKRAAELGLVPADVKYVRMGTTPDWNGLSRHKRERAMREMQAYAAMATAMDREIGRLIDHLKSAGDYENSIIIFLSDNGAEPIDPYARLRNRLFLGMQVDRSIENIGRRGSMDAIGPAWASAASSPLRGYKFSATEGGLRVPFILHWAGGLQPRREDGKTGSGAIAKGFAHVTDILPTIAELADIPLPDGVWNGRQIEDIWGLSLVPMLKGGDESVHQDRPLGYELSGNAALFRGDYKLVRNLPPTGDGSWRLYDIKKDPGEVLDLSLKEPQRFSAMLADYQAYADENGVLDMPEGYNSDDQILLYAERQNAPIPQIVAGAMLLISLGLIGGLYLLWRRRRARRIH